MSRLSVVGAEWCPHSRNQAKALGCDTDETDPNRQTTCKAKIGNTEDTVNFVYCQDINRNPINQDHELCQNSDIKGYPAWLENGNVSEKLDGLMNPCDVPGLNKNQLNCAAYENAQVICQKAQQDSQQAMEEFEDEYKTAQQHMMQAVKPLEKQMMKAVKPLEKQVQELQEKHLRPVALKIESVVEPHKQACMAAQEEAKPQW